jgi:hypothetical protein
MTAQIRVSKMVVAALLGAGLPAGGLMVPTGLHAQTTGGGTVVSLTVEEKNQKKVVECDVKLNLENLPEGAEAEFTTTATPGHPAKTYRGLKRGTYCLKNGVLASTSGGGVTATGTAGGPGGCTTRTIIGPDGSPITICE